MLSNAQVAQRMRRERERQSKANPIQQRFFPGLTPRPGQHAAYKRDCTQITNHFLNRPSMLDPGPSEVHPTPILNRTSMLDHEPSEVHTSPILNRQTMLDPGPSEFNLPPVDYRAIPLENQSSPTNPTALSVEFGQTEVLR